MNKIKINLSKNEAVTTSNNILELDISIARKIYDKMLVEYTCEDIRYHIRDLIEDGLLSPQDIKRYHDEDDNKYDEYDQESDIINIIKEETIIMLAQKVISKEDCNIDYNSLIDDTIKDFFN